MKYYRFVGKDDLWLGKYGKSQMTLIPNELLTQKEIDKIKKDCPRLSIEKTFKVVDLPTNKTYSAFGARFENDTDHNSKLESLKLRTVTRSTKTKRGIKESVGGTVTLKDMNTDVMPVVDFGCYGGPLSTILDEVFVYDSVNLDAFDPNDEYYDEVVKLIEDEYDGTEEFFNQVLSYAPNTIQDAFNEYGIRATVVPNSCKWNRPQFYNYSDDCIEFDMSVDTGWVESKFRELSNDANFKKFLRNNFSSRSGFISYMPDDVNEYDELLDPSNNEYWKVVSAIVNYLVSEDTSIRDNITYDLEDSIISNAEFVTITDFM